MANRTDQPHEQHSPHTPRNCKLCASLQHPALAKQGRALTRHLAQHPFPRQAVTA